MTANNADLEKAGLNDYERQVYWEAETLARAKAKYESWKQKQVK